MKSYVLGLYEKSMPNTLPLREKLAAAKRNGYDFLELSIDETEEKLARLDWDGRTRQDVLQAGWDAGLPIRSICLSGHRKYPLGHPNPVMRLRGMEIMEKAIGLAAGLGIRTIQLAGYDVYYEESSPQTRADFETNLRKSVELAARAGVVLAFETMETDFLNTVKKGMYWVKKMDSPYLQMYPDAGNITNAAAAGEDVLNDLEAGRGHLAALHLKESRPGVFREVPYGSGHVAFGPVTHKAYELGVRRYLAEFWYDGSSDWESVLRDNARFLRNFLDRAAEGTGV